VSRLLLAFDGSPAAQRALELVAGYAGGAGRLAATVVNVQARPVSFWPEGALDVRAVEASLEQAGRDLLRPALERLAASDVAAQPAVRLGLPAQAIVQEAPSCSAAAIVMGTRGAGVLGGFALGSVALRVAHASAVPVLLVKPEDRLPAALGRNLRVLLAVDGSAPALRAAERLAAWRAWLGALEVHLAYVQQPLSYLATVLPPHDDVMRQWSTEAGEKAAQAARDALERVGVKPRLHLTIGDPALEIRALAEETAAELVVLGTRGLGAAHHALVGSVALKVAAMTARPALLVP
jgi:nucleotide-binding universal stress UspA family protein